MSGESRIRKSSVKDNTVNNKEIGNDNKSRRKISQMDGPKDKYFLANLLFFFTGLVGMLPVQFFLVATNYWMYKLRDTQYDTYDLDKKTYYQKMFVSFSSLAQGFPSLVGAFLSAKFAYKLDVRLRFVWTLGAMSFLFIIFTILVKVDTDSWQTLFFVTALTVISIITIFHPLYSQTNMALMSQFPSKYIKMNMYGSAVAGIFSACLQIISLTISDSPIDVALIYFSSGTVIIMFTCFLTYFMNQSPVIQFFWKRDDKEYMTPSYSLREFKDAAIKIWPLIAIVVITTGTAGVGHPNITNLVVSDGYNDNKDDPWYAKYYVPTVTYLGADIFTLVGRFFGKAYITRKNGHWFILLSAVRAFGIGPLFLFCNAKPRDHLPVLFPYDFEYILLLSVYTFSSSIIMTSQMMSTAQLAGEHAEVAFVLMQVMTTTITTITSFLNPVYVKLL